MDRKEFLYTCGALCGFSVLLSSCKNIRTIQGYSTGEKVGINKKEMEELPMIIVNSSKFHGPVLLRRTGETFDAVSLICSHKGCELNPSGNRLVCPCHGSEFTLEGKVLNPPASKDLQKYLVTSEGDVIYIQP